MGEAVRTLPNGVHAVRRSHGSGWFGVEGYEPADAVDVIDVGCDVVVAIGPAGQVVGVGYLAGPVTDSVLFYALQQVVPTVERTVIE
jgi:hypothetical protein